MSRGLDRCCMVRDDMQTCQCLPGVRQPWTGKRYSTILLENLERAAASNAALYSKILFSVASIPEHSLQRN